MGYKSGQGLGKNEQGITRPVDVTFQLGKKGLGMRLKNTKDIEESWNFSDEVTRHQNINNIMYNSQYIV